MGSKKRVKAAMTQTLNQFGDMPNTVDRLSQLSGRMDEVRQANLKHHADLARHAQTLGVEVICFGEVFTGPYFAIRQDEVFFELAETLDGPTSQFCRALAKELGMVIVAPIYEVEAGTQKRHNTALVIDANGEQLGFYSKTHIPHGKNEQGVFAEGFYFEPSVGRPQEHPRVNSRNPFFPVFDTAAGRIGVSICYDRHFEGVVSTLAAEGAQIVFSPAVTFGEKSARMWPLEFAVDAMRNRVYLGGSNRRGAEPPWNQDFFGHTQFMGPGGRLNDLSDHPEIVVAELDLEDLAQPEQSGWNLTRDKRPNIYGRRAPQRQGKRPWHEPGE
jgi:N-carbamoylputrescine amidase